MGTAGRYRNSRYGNKALVLGLAVAGGMYLYISSSFLIVFFYGPSLRLPCMANWDICDLGAYYYYTRESNINRVACEGIERNTKSPEKALGWTGFTTLTLRETQDMGKNAKVKFKGIPTGEAIPEVLTKLFPRILAIPI